MFVGYTSDTPCPESDHVIFRQAPPEVWVEDNPPGLAPIVIALKPGAYPVAVRQYPLNREASLGILPHLEHLKSWDIILPCQFPWNTPLFPVPKLDGSWRPVQDLCAINSTMETIHPVVSNPYVLLGLIPQAVHYFSILDLKDAFFCRLVAPISGHGPLKPL